jgi:tetratricopeptide (TPR) repeat protein
MGLFRKSKYEKYKESKKMQRDLINSFYDSKSYALALIEIDSYIKRYEVFTLNSWDKEEEGKKYRLDTACIDIAINCMFKEKYPQEEIIEFLKLCHTRSGEKHLFSNNIADPNYHILEFSSHLSLEDCNTDQDYIRRCRDKVNKWFSNPKGALPKGFGETKDAPKPAETKPAETKPAETKPSETAKPKGALPKGFGETKDAPKPAETKSAYTVAYEKGVHLHKLEMYDEAIACYDEAIRLDPEHSDAWRSKGVALYALEKHEESIPCFDEAIRLDPDPEHSLLWWRKGNSLLSLERYEEAIACYDEEIRLDPDKENYRMYLEDKQTALEKLGRDNEAKQVKAMVHDIYERKEAEKELGSKISDTMWATRKAERKILKEALQKSDIDKAISLENQGRYKDAMIQYSRAMRLDIRDDVFNSTVCVRKGKLYDELGKPQQALDIGYDEAIRLDPENITAWFNKCNTLNFLERYDEAIACSDEAIRLDPEFFGGWYGKGNSASNLGKYEESILSYDEAIRLDPEHPPTWAGKSLSLSNLERYDEAIACSDEAIRLDPEFFGGWHGKSKALTLLGRYEEAIVHYKKIILLAPEFLPAWSDLGSVLEKVGRYSDAQQCFTKVKESGNIIFESRFR